MRPSFIPWWYAYACFYRACTSCSLAVALTQNNSLGVEGRPRAVEEWVVTRYIPSQGPESIDGLHEEYLQWYMRMQPVDRNPVSFLKMKAASFANPAAYAPMMSMTKRGVVLLVHALSWMFRPGFEFSTTGPARFASHNDLIADLTDVLRVMGTLCVMCPDIAA